MTRGWLRIGVLVLSSSLVACLKSGPLLPEPGAGSAGSGGAQDAISTGGLNPGHPVTGTGGTFEATGGAGSITTIDPNICPADTPASCGNGTLDIGEQCDPGDSTSGIPGNFGANTCATVIPGT